MDDWGAPVDEEREDAAAGACRARRRRPIRPRSTSWRRSSPTPSSPAIVVGAGADDRETWAALVELAERLVAPVFQESFGARAGFPQDHPLFAGFLPADRPRLREKLAPYDAVLVVGAPVFRQSPYAPGRFTEAGTADRASSATDPDEVHRSPAELAVLAPAGGGLPRARGADPAARRRAARSSSARRLLPSHPAGEPLHGRPRARRARRSGFRATRSSSRRRRSTGPSCTTGCSRASRSASSAPRWAASASRSPARPASGWRCPTGPVVAVVGDGSSIYGIQALWSAAHYERRRPVRDPLERRLRDHGPPRRAPRASTAPWPAFDVDVAAVARGFGCTARRISTHDELVAALDEVVPDARDARRARSCSTW